MNTLNPRAPSRSTLWVAVAVVSAVTYAADLVSKEWALRNLNEGAYVPLIGEYFGLQLIYNPGAAFSFLTGATWVFTIISVAVVIFLITLCRRLASLPWAITIALLLGGTFGNLTDRLIRDPGFGVGHVVDFLNYNGYFVGNVADIFIVLAAIALAVLAFMGVPLSAARFNGEVPIDEPEVVEDPEEGSIDE